MFPPDASGLEALARRTFGLSPAVEALAGDVGRRRYFRLAPGGRSTAIGVVYPADEDDSRRRWLAAHARLSSRVRVPAVLADDGQGNQIVEDFGRADLAERFASSPEERRGWLVRAARTAAVIADTPDPRINPPFDAALFLRELDMARDAVFGLRSGPPLSDAERGAHDAWARDLVAEVLAHPRTLCHRDFHANNLFACGEDVGVIDFQDLREGPDAYDLASLLWERTTLTWMTRDDAGEAIRTFAGLRGDDPGALAARLDRVLLQRAWKVCGTFARAISEGRGETYRRYLKPELALVRSLLTRTAGDRRFAEVLAGRTAPVC